MSTDLKSSLTRRGQSSTPHSFSGTTLAEKRYRKASPERLETHAIKGIKYLNIPGAYLIPQNYRN